MAGLCRIFQRVDVTLGKSRQHIASAQKVTQAQGRASQGSQRPEPNGPIGAGNGDVVARGGEDLARCACPLSGMRLTNHNELIGQADLCSGERVPIAAHIQTTDSAQQLRNRAVKAQGAGGLRAIRAGVIVALAQILWLAVEGAALQLVEHLGKAIKGCAVTFRVEAKGGFILRDRETALGEDIAFVHPALDHVPCDAVFRGPFENGPVGRVQTCAFGQRAIVEIHRPAAGLGNHCFGQYPQVGNRQQPIKFALDVTRGSKNLQPFGCGPGDDLGTLADHSPDLVTTCQQSLATPDQQGFIANDDG